MTNPPVRRGAHTWRWVAHEPDRVPGPGGASTRQAPAPVRGQPSPPIAPGMQDRTPAYGHLPRWGLPWPPFAPPPPATGPATADDRSVTAFLARQSAPVLVMTQWIMLLAVVAHAFRYVMLAVYARSLTPTWVEVLSTALAWASGLFAFGAGAVAVLCAVGWVVQTRSDTLTPLRDARPRLAQWLSCLVPPLNLAYPVVLLRELEALARWRRDDPAGRAEPPRAPAPDTSRWVTRWWLLWVLNWLLLGVVIWRGSADGPQAAADTVALTALVLAVAATVAWMTRRVMQCFDDASQGFTKRYFVAGFLD